MADMQIKTSNGFRQIILICIFFLFVCGCSNLEESGGVDGSGSGTISIQLAWRNTANEIEAIDPPSGDVCVDFQIETVNVQVINDSVAIAPRQRPCNEHGVDMTEIPAGSGYQVVVDGLIGDVVTWQGSSDSNITVIAGQAADPVTVAMDYIGDDSDPPTATTSPADLAADVDTDTVISIAFSEAVVEASLTGESIIVSDGAGNVTGTLDYNADTYTLTFQPSQDLTVSTTYTITVTTDVMDAAGFNLAQNVSSSFSTTRVWYVDGSAAAGSGQSWSDPFNTVSAAVAAASDGEQIWVKAGTYLLSQQNVAIQILINKAVEILGGFAGTETQEHQRDWSTLTTTIDGEESYRCFFLSADATLDGFTITRGALVGSEPGGAGMYIDTSAPHIVNCTFSENNISGSAGYGGAIYIASGNPVITDCTFQDNRVTAISGYSGAIYNDQGGPTISGCIFRNNRSSNGYGNSAGAIYNKVAQATTTISNCIFDNNSTLGEGSTGGAIYNSNSDISILNCRFKNNSCSGLFYSYGGAIYNYSSDVLIENTIFSNNSAGSRDAGRGGAIYNSSSSPTITNCTFVFNETSAWESTDILGGAISNHTTSNPIITNCILWDNQAQNGSQIYDDAGSSTTVTASNIDQSGYSGNLRKYPRFGASFHLRADSPCIDQGDNAAATAFDIDGESRPQSSAADIGADEFRDSDNDNVPDYWEIINGLNFAVDDADSDSDGDLLPTLAEYQLDTDPNSSDTVLNGIDRGAWSSTGDHTALDKSTPTGNASGNYRSFFIFDLSSLATTIGTAAVRLELTNYGSIDAVETIQAYDVSTDTTTLAADGTGQAAIYDDLGSGDLYGDFDVTPTDQNTVLDIQLNSETVSDINAAAGGQFAIGLKLESSGEGGLSFSDASEDRTHQLILVAE